MAEGSLEVHHSLRIDQWSTHLRGVPGLGGGAVVHALNEVPSV